MVMPPLASSSCMALPTPQMKPTGFAARKLSVSARPSTEKPRGFSRSEASFARNLLCDRPTEAVMPTFSRDARDEMGQRQGRAHAMQPCRAGEVEEGLVDRQRFDQRRHLQHQLAHLAFPRRHISPCRA